MYEPTRPIMTADELASHKVTEYGRDYRESYDGYGDMGAEERRGWRAIASWGRDGWDLGKWPYVVIYFRETNPGTLSEDGKLTRTYQLMQIVEGDRTVYHFDSKADREAATDYLFLWYAADQWWAPVKEDQREALDRGELPDIPVKYRGPYRVRD